MTSSGSSFNDIPENQLTKFSASFNSDLALANVSCSLLVPLHS